MLALLIRIGVNKACCVLRLLVCNHEHVVCVSGGGGGGGGFRPFRIIASYLPSANGSPEESIHCVWWSRKPGLCNELSSEEILLTLTLKYGCPVHPDHAVSHDCARWQQRSVESARRLCIPSRAGKHSLQMRGSVTCTSKRRLWRCETALPARRSWRSNSRRKLLVSVVRQWTCHPCVCWLSSFSYQLKRQSH